MGSKPTKYMHKFLNQKRKAHTKKGKANQSKSDAFNNSLQPMLVFLQI